MTSTPVENNAQNNAADLQKPSTVSATSLFKLIIVAAGYFLLAHLGLLLALSPTQASPFWPAAGFGLAALLCWGLKYWPGIWLGCLVYLLTDRLLLSGQDLTLSLLTLLMIISTGATLQTVLGARLVRPFFTTSTTLAYEKDILLFLLIAGPLACIISASISISGLYLIEDLPRAHLRGTWLIWWSGDSLGVLLFAPLFILMLSPNHNEWYGRKLQIVVPLLITAGLVIGTYHFLNRAEQSDAEKQFNQAAESVKDRIIISLENLITSVQSTVGLLEASEQVTAEEFAIFTRRLIGHSGLKALAWVPRVSESERIDFEMGTQQATSNAFNISGAKISGVDQAKLPAISYEYYPILYIESSVEQSIKPGTDLNHTDRSSLQHAMNSGQVTLSERPTLFSTADFSADSWQVYLAVYKNGFIPEIASIGDRRAALKGFVIGVFHLEHDFTLLNPLIRQSLGYRLTRTTFPDARRTLMEHGVPANRSDTPDSSYQMFELAFQGLELELWNLSPRVSGQSATDQTYLVVIVLVSLLSSLFVLASAGQRVLVAREVIERTTELNESEQRVKDILNGMAFYAGEMAPDGVLREVNQTALTAAGLRPDQVIGKKLEDTWWFSYSPDVQNQVRSAIKRASQGESVRFDLWIRMQGENLIPVDFSLAPVLDDDGQVIRLIPSSIDISTRKLAEQEIQTLNQNLEGMIKERTDSLRKSEREFRATFELAAVGIVHLSEDGRLLRVNPQMCDISGYSSLELIGKHMADYVHSEDLEKENIQIKALLSGSQSDITLDLRLMHKHRMTVWINLSASLVTNDNESVEYIIAFIKDISARKNAEKKVIAQQAELNELLATLEQRVAERTAELETAARTLASKEEEIRSVIEYLVESVITIDSQGTIRAANPATLKLFGYTREELLGKNISMLMPEPYKNEHDDYLRHYRETGEARIIGTGREVEGCHKSGEIIKLELAVSEYTFDGELFFTGILRDIREHKRISQELQDARQAAEDASRAKSAFLAAMSHEIRTPMNGVIGMVEVLEQSSLGAEQLEMVELIHDSAFSLLSIIDDILDFSKIEAGSLEMEQVPFSVEEVVEKVCTLLRRLAAKKGVELTLFTDPAIPLTLAGDPLRLRQMLLNLAGNAIKFSSRSDLTGRVQVRAICENLSQERASIRFEVIDNGIGMDQPTIDRLFTAFTQADTSTTRRFGGTGLGLVITHNLAKLMAGSISVQSEPEQGSTFILNLPFGLPDSITEAPQPGHLELDGLHCRIFSDSDTLIKDLSAYLVASGATLLGSSSLASILPKPTLHEEMSPGDLWIIDNAQSNGPVEMRNALIELQSSLGIPFLLLGHGQRKTPRAIRSGVTEIDTHVLKRKVFLQAVCLATGRNSYLNIRTPKQISQPTSLLSRDDALLAGRLILVAEDNETNQKVIRQQLGLLGYTADIVSNGREALQRLEQTHYALLITDLHMPEMDGYELTRAIRKAETAAEHLPIIALTANALKSEAAHCLASGMDGYLSKPATLKELKETLRQWIPAIKPATPGISDGRHTTDSPLNLNVLEKMIGNDPDTIRDFLQDFQQSATQIAEELIQGYESEDLKRTESAAHKLKSSARSFGAMQLGELCESIEQAARGMQTTLLDELLPDFKDEISRVDHFLSAQLSQHDDN
ncbi:PAS domain S-box protein [Nitrincola sp. MINF-07-Sa-05]|uniref:PAS domain S-box protein n=1 Tax=Nitrincola salilacus TaxID=3400273 RepID=UPI00391842DD